MHACDVKSQAGLWVTYFLSKSSSGVQQPGSLLSFSTPTIFHPYCLPSSLSTLFTLLSSVQPVPFSSPRTFMLPTIHTYPPPFSGLWSICDGTQAKADAQALRLLDVVSSSLPSFGPDGKRRFEMFTMMFIWINWKHYHCFFGVGVDTLGFSYKINIIAISVKLAFF